jgi:hypothetical protein
LAAADLKRRFRDLEAGIDASVIPGELDSETKAGLEALGYAD